MKLTFDLKKGTLKTVFISPDMRDLTFLIDTGADTPVWCKGEAEFKDIFPHSEKMESKFLLSGFGKEPEIVAVYKISEFKMEHAQSHLALISQSIKEIDGELEKIAVPYSEHIANMSTIPGITEKSALYIISEIGTDTG